MVIWGLASILAKRASGKHTGRSRSYPRPSQRDDRCAPWKWTSLLSFPNTNDSSCKKLVPAPGQLISLYWYHCPFWCLAMIWLQRLHSVVLLLLKKTNIEPSPYGFRITEMNTYLLSHNALLHTEKIYPLPTYKQSMNKIHGKILHPS